MRFSRWIVLGALMCALAGGATVRPDFSGTWKLNNDQSTRDGTPDRVYICEIQQKGDTITVSTKATPAPPYPPLDGTFRPTSKPVVDKRAKDYHTTSAHWEGNTFIIEVVDKVSGKETAKVLGAIRESWVLSPDGKVLTKFRQNAANGKVVDQKYVFDKQ